uniref:Uncharacterized protein n=1 Tax=Anguilla anguilla TaxID=7936 RepID=A0A0E9V534_ANGAN
MFIIACTHEDMTGIAVKRS